jgi:glycerophosphoryl diester phosphodiesterase
MEIVGHRGIRAGGHIPENSLPAFIEAYNRGAHGVEFDVCLTSDDQLLIMHDRTLNRTTGRSGEVREKLYSQIREFPLINEKTGEPTTEYAPRLDEVLKTVQKIVTDHPDEPRAQKFKINIELKDSDDLQQDPSGKNLVDLVLKCISVCVESTNISQEHFVISSFNMNALAAVKNAAPHLHRRMLVSTPVDPVFREWRHNSDLNQMEYASTAAGLGTWVKGRSFDRIFDDLFTPLERIWEATPTEIYDHLEQHWEQVQPHSVALPISAITHEVANDIRRRGAEIVVWTSAEQNPELRSAGEHERLMQCLKQRDVRTMITDYPGEVARLLSVVA